MSESQRRQAAEAGLVGIAAVWGLTFVMNALLILVAIVAVEILPRMRPPRPLPEG